ncbi:hypothetical protein MRB53_042019 [Persea americana]|nr:hypothetical protein MRB53_042019 [Persea americana]
MAMISWSFGLVALVPFASYLVLVALLTIPVIQNQAVYLNAVRLTWGKDLLNPEPWGFLRNQVRPFTIKTTDNETLLAWHILPLEIYRQDIDTLSAEPPGLLPDSQTGHAFKMLKEDRETLLVLYFHGAAGTLGSGWRPASYRGISASGPIKIHIVAIDYRGYGLSTGSPSESGLLTDAVAVTRWAIDVAGIPSSRIVIFGQSLGTAIAVSLAHHMAKQSPPVHFSGIVLVAPFADVALLTATYKIGGTLPLLSPIARFPQLHVDIKQMADEGQASGHGTLVWTRGLLE